MKIRLFIFCFIILFTEIGKSQSWVQNQDIPYSRMLGQGATFNIGTKIYLVGGALYNPSDRSNIVWEYDQVMDSWIRKSDFPGTKRIYPNAFSINGKGYYFGGEDTISGTNNELWEYDPVNDSWLQKTSLPGPPRGAAITFVINSKGYVISGAQVFGIVLNDVWEYEPINDSWIQKTSMPTLGRAWGAGFAIGNKGYAGLGSSYSDYFYDWWEFDPIADTWTSKDSLPSSVSSPAAFSIGSYGYVGPGWYNMIAYNSFFRFDPSTGNWTQLPNFPGTNVYDPYSISCNGKGYVISGSNGSNCDSTTWEFTPPVGIEEYSDNSCSVFPSPSNDVVNVFLNQNILLAGSVFTIEIFDLTGKVIRRENGRKANHSFTIEKENLPAGIYYFTVSDAENVLGRGKIVFE